MPELRPYQVQGVEFLRANPRAFLADEMGIGKTCQLIRASEGRTLVVAPAMVLQGGTWRDEIEKWADDPDRFVCAPYTSLNNRRGREILATPRDQFKGPWDTIIFDEAHYLKGRKTSWALLGQKMAKKVPRVYQATGTPIPNWAQELFNATRILYPEDAKPGGRLGSFERWAEQWFEIEDDPWTSHKKIVGNMAACIPACANLPALGSCEHYREFFEANLGKRYLQRLRDDVLPDLPPLTRVEVSTPMERKQAKAYRDMRDHLVVEYADGSLRVAWQDSEKHIVLDQLATAFEDSSGKFERLRFDLAQRTRPTLVVAHYTATVRACETVADNLGMSAMSITGASTPAHRARAVANFKAGRLDVLVGSLETIAEGLTLTVADMIIFVEKSWKPSRNQQAERRIHRFGQVRPTVALDYVTPNSIDANKRVLLQEKNDHQMRTLTWGQIKPLL